MAQRSTTRKPSAAEVELPSDGRQWESCPAGTLKKFAALRNSRRLHRRLVGSGIVAAMVCIVVGAPLLLNRTIFNWNNSSLAPVHSPYGGLSCREVIDRMDAFFASTLEVTFHQRVLQHLQFCPSCKRHYEQTAAQLGDDVSSLPISLQARPSVLTPCHDGKERNVN